MRRARWLTSTLVLAAVALVATAQETSRPASPDSNAGQATSTQTPQTSRAKGSLEILTDTQGVDFGPYLSKVLKAVRMNWYSLIPEHARPPELKQGQVSIEFVILQDGHVAGMKIAQSSGDVPMDRAAWGGITASQPFAPLPEAFPGKYLGLRFHFYYNPPKGSVQDSTSEKK